MCSASCVGADELECVATAHGWRVTGAPVPMPTHPAAVHTDKTIMRTDARNRTTFSLSRLRGVLSGQGSLNKLPRRVCLLLVPQAHKRHARYSRSSELAQVGSLEVLLSLPR